MTRAVRSFAICLAFGLSVAAGGLVHEDFFLAERATRDIRSAYGLGISGTEVTAAVDVEGFPDIGPSLGYRGLVIKPRRDDRDLQEDHRLLLALPLVGGGMVVGLQGRLAVDALVKETDEAQDGWIGEESEHAFYYHKMRLDLVNRTRTAGGGAANVHVPFGHGMLTLELAGTAWGYAGYVLSADRVESRGMRIVLQEHEPRDWSHSWSTGLLYTRCFSFFSRPSYLVTGMHYRRSVDRQPLRGELTPLPSSTPGNDMVVTNRGRRHERRAFQAWAGIMPRTPSSRARGNMLAVGRFLHGFTVPEVVVRYNFSRDSSVYYELVSRSHEMPAQPATEIDQVRHRSILARLMPELFLFKHLSLALPWELEFTYRGDPDMFPDLLYGRIAGQVRLSCPAGPDGLVELVLRSGELETNAPIPLRDIDALPARYRVYRQEVSLRFLKKISGARGVIKGEEE